MEKLKDLESFTFDEDVSFVIKRRKGEGDDLDEGGIWRSKKGN